MAEAPECRWQLRAKRGFALIRLTFCHSARSAGHAPGSRAVTQDLSKFHKTLGGLPESTVSSATLSFANAVHAVARRKTGLEMKLPSCCSKKPLAAGNHPPVKPVLTYKLARSHTALGKLTGSGVLGRSLAAQAQSYMDAKLVVGNLTWSVVGALRFDARDGPKDADA